MFPPFKCPVLHCKKVQNFKSMARREFPLIYSNFFGIGLIYSHYITYQMGRIPPRMWSEWNTLLAKWRLFQVYFTVYKTTISLLWFVIVVWYKVYFTTITNHNKEIVALYAVKYT